MNEEICDFRFAICDWARLSSGSTRATVSLSLTPRFSGVCEARRAQNRFSGFKRAAQTAQAVQAIHRRRYTLLKQGVNETSKPMVRICVACSRLSFQIANRKSKML
jgi:hypothetical protein